MLAANASGTEKLKPFFIGKSARPHCFRQVKSSPVELQPLDQGIIRNFKCFYRKEDVQQIIFDIEEKQKTNISLLHAVKFVDKACKNVTQSTIVKCFKKPGFTNEELNSIRRQALENL